MNLGINNNYQYSPAFGALRSSTKGFIELYGNCLCTSFSERNSIYEGLKRAETSTKADLIIDKDGQVFVGYEDKMYRPTFDGFSKFDGDRLCIDVVDDSDNQYKIKFNFDNPADAESLWGKYRPGSLINAGTMGIFNAIEDGVDFTITPISKK